MKTKIYSLIFSCIIGIGSFLKAGTTTTYTISVNGTNREYIIYVPSIYDGKRPVPLMLNIHGYSMSDASQQNMINFDPVADTANFIVARPRAISSNWSPVGEVSDGQANRDFIWQMIEKIKADFNINPCRIYSAGFSQGSFMSQMLVINVDNPSRAPVIAAIGSSSGGISKGAFGGCTPKPSKSYWDAKNPTHPVPVLHLHGTSDNTIAYNGGGTHCPASVDELMDFWVNHNNCNTTPTMTTCGSIDHYIWSGGDRGTRVELYKVNSGSHSAPNNSCVNSGKVIWEFCSQFCLPYLTSTTCTKAPTISSQPTSQTVASGNNTMFAVTANGCEGTPITYQWQVDNGSGFSNLTNTAPYSGVSTATLTVSSATTGLNNYKYRCYVSSCCDNSNSSIATLTVTSGCIPPEITSTTPGSKCDLGANSNDVILGATASAGTINWYVAATGGSSIYTGTSYTVSNVSNTTTYYVDATNNGCTTSSRTAVTVTVLTNPGGCMSGNQTICSGESATITTTLSGDGPWDFNYSINGIDQTQVTVTSSPYTVTATAAGNYQISHLSNSTGCSAVICSALATITKNSPITVSQPTIVCNGTDTEYTVEFEITGGDVPSYKVTGDGGNMTTNTRFVSNAIASGTTYSFVVTDSFDCSPVTVSGTKTCGTSCNATALISGDDTICANGVATIEIALTGNPPWNIVYAIDGQSQVALNATSKPFTFTTSVAGVYSLVSVTDLNNCVASKSGTATIKKHESIVASTPVITCSNDNTTYTVDFDLSGGDTLSYLLTGDVGSMTSNTHFTSATIASGTMYTFNITDKNNCTPVVVSGTKTCGVVCAATATISGSTTVCSGAAATVTIDLTGKEPWTVVYAVDGNNQPSVVALSSPYTFTTIVTGNYTLASVLDANSCTAQLSGSANINSFPAITTSLPTKTCDGNNTNYVVEFDIISGDAPYTVTGATMTTASHYVSNTIASGTSYTISLTDAHSCKPLLLTGSHTCSTATVVCNAAAAITSGDITVCEGETANVVIGLSGNPPFTLEYSIDGNNQAQLTNITASTYTLNASSSGVYSLVSLMDNNSCNGNVSGSVTITVNEKPTIVINAEPANASVCKGESVTLTASGAVTHTWTGGISNDVSFVPTTSKAYTVTATAANGCKSTKEKTVSVNDLPKVGVVVSPSATICKGQSVTLTGTGAAGYVWSGGINNAEAFIPTNTETFTVTGTAMNTCSAKAVQKIVVNDCVGVEELGLSEQISIYPNPAINVLNIVASVGVKEMSIQIINMMGAEVYASGVKTFVIGQVQQVDVSEFSRGVYYVNIKAKNGTLVKKLIIQ